MSFGADTHSTEETMSNIKKIQVEDRWMESPGPAINNLPAIRSGEDCFHSGTEGGKDTSMNKG